MTTIDDTTLEQFAREHVSYELTELIDQVTHPALTGSDDVLRRSLIESSLGHMRLLDEFFHYKAAREPYQCMSCGEPLCCQACEEPHLRPADSVTAQHFLPTWLRKPRALSGKDRDAVMAQLSHLAERRQTDKGWALRSMAARVCEVFIEFVDQLQASDPQRAAWFADAYQRAVGATTAEPRLSTSMEMSTTSPTTKVSVTRALPRQAPGPGADE